MSSSIAKNLAVIDRALKQHNDSCDGTVVEIRMNPFEAARLNWEDFKGIPVVGDPEIGTGRFRLVCSKEKQIDEELDDTAVESDLIKSEV